MNKISKYKLLRDLPNVDAGAVLERCVDMTNLFYVKDNYGDFYEVSECVVLEKTDWFAPYLFHCKSKDIYLGDVFYMVIYKTYIKSNEGVSDESPNELYNKVNDGIYIPFLTKKEAQEYLDSLKPKFKVGDIVRSFNKGYIDVITEVCQVGENIPLWNYKTNFTDTDISGSNFRLADESEIIKYYEQQGWVKGAKFKCKDGIKTLCEEDTVYINQVGEATVNSTEYCQYQLKDCELIKEPVYPKSFEEIEFNGSRFYHIEDDCIGTTECKSKLNFATEKQAISSSAYSQLTQLHKNIIDEYNKFNNCDWKPNWKTKEHKHFIVRKYEYLTTISTSKHYSSLAFPNKDLAEFALKEWNELWKQLYELN